MSVNTSEGRSGEGEGSGPPRPRFPAWVLGFAVLFGGVVWGLTDDLHLGLEVTGLAVSMVRFVGD